MSREELAARILLILLEKAPDEYAMESAPELAVDITNLLYKELSK